MIFPVLLSLAAAADPISAAGLADVFAAACLDGQAHLSADQVTAVPLDSLPNEVRRQLGQPKAGDIWRLNGQGRSYLYVLNYVAANEGSKICGLASDAMSLAEATAMLERRIDGYVLRDKTRSMQWWRPHEGYVATATTAGKFNVLQLRWLGAKERKRALQEMKWMGAEVPRDSVNDGKPNR
jgi:hypothetical protein